MNIGTNLSNIMYAKKVKVKELAELTGLKIDTIKSIIYGRSKNPSLYVVKAIADTLHVSLEALATDSNLMDAEILDLYNRCTPQVQATLKMIAANNIVRQNTLSLTESRKIKLVIPSSLEDDGIINDTCETQMIECANDKAFIGYKIMTNNFFDYRIYKNDVVLLERRDPDENEIGVFTDGVKSYFRKLHNEDNCYVLKALNKRAKDIIVKKNERDLIWTCTGTYIGKL